MTKSNVEQIKAEIQAAKEVITAKSEQIIDVELPSLFTKYPAAKAVAFRTMAANNDDGDPSGFSCGEFWVVLQADLDKFADEGEEAESVHDLCASESFVINEAFAETVTDWDHYYATKAEAEKTAPKDRWGSSNARGEFRDIPNPNYDPSLSEVKEAFSELLNVIPLDLIQQRFGEYSSYVTIWADGKIETDEAYDY